MGIRDALKAELAQAMRRRDTVVSRTLRTALSELDNAQAPPAVDVPTSTSGSVHVAGAVHGLGAAEVPRIHRSEEQQRAIVATELAEISGHAERLTSLCRHEEADSARRAAEALSRALDATD